MGRECANAPGPSNFRGCDLTARMAPRHGACPGAIPGSRTSSLAMAISHGLFRSTRRAPACAAGFPKPSGLGAAPRRRATFKWRMANSEWRMRLASAPVRHSQFVIRHFLRGRGRKVMHLPCKQAQAGALPAVLHQFHCGENEIQASLISSASVGATPTPATNLREVIRPPGCNPGVSKSRRKRRLERYQHFPPFHGPVAQASRAPRCLREG